jgi:hypothetical protein
MPMADSNFIQCNIRVPQPLHQEIETIAIANGAKINSRSQKPQMASTLATTQVLYVLEPYH